MIHISKLEIGDISYMLGLWHALMGGETARILSRSATEQWLCELKSGGPYLPREIDSRWHSSCDLCLAVEPAGGVYALCYNTIAVCSKIDQDACTTARAFEETVRSLT
jgi:hypothetical protein